MIYLVADSGQHIVILEPGNLEAMQKGGFEKTPNGQVLVFYTPDAAWLGEQMVANFANLDGETIQRLVAESQKRPEVKDRPYHPLLHIEAGKTNES